MVKDPSEQLLLVRHTYGEVRDWRLPGGAIRTREHAVTAAKRETMEEVGCRLRDVTVQQFYTWAEEGFEVELWIVTARTSDVPTPDGVEIAEAAFFPPDLLPAPIAPEVTEHLERIALRQSFGKPVPAYIRPEFLDHLRTGGSP